MEPLKILHRPQATRRPQLAGDLVLPDFGAPELEEFLEEHGIEPDDVEAP